MKMSFVNDYLLNRSMHQTLMNVISVEVHFGSSYFFSNGALHPCTGACACMELSIDKRKTVADLLSTLTKEVSFPMFYRLLVIDTVTTSCTGFPVAIVVEGLS